MRLLQRKNGGEFSLTDKYDDDNIPPYAILSHTWGADSDEVSFKDIIEGTGKHKAGYNKIKFCGNQIASDDLQYFWVDTCCIDKSNSAELNEAITSMFDWYCRATKCYVYLPDVLTCDDFAAFLNSKWFTRGWTLQELIAPASVEFFSKDGHLLGDKKFLKDQIHRATGIAIQALEGSPLSCFTVEERLSWTECRKTKRKEDAAYCLLGIFGVKLVANYGEGGDSAMSRLYREIDRKLKPESLRQTSTPCKTGLSLLIDPESPSLDIVFVHGFTGHPEYTWSWEQQEVGRKQNDHNDTEDERSSKRRKLFPSATPHERRNGDHKSIFWPRDLVPTAVPNARILTYGYDTSSDNCSSDGIEKSATQDIAWDFLLKLESVRRFQSSRPLLLVAHGLGGVVIMEMLRRSSSCKTYQHHLNSIYGSTSGILFFGTPHSGPNLRELVRDAIEKSTGVENFRVNDQIINSFLLYAEQLKTWDEMVRPIARHKRWPIYSFQPQYDDMALRGQMGVEDTASRLNDPIIECVQQSASNHMEMCRFRGHDDDEYKKVIKVIVSINQRANGTTESAHSGKIATSDVNPRQEFMDRLKFDQIDARHATIKTAHAKTCQWLLSKSEYKDWLDDTKISDHNGFLWVKGKPGTGKSTLMKFAFETAKKAMADTIVISFFFNARGEELEKSVLGMYRSLLFQLLERLPDIQDPFELLGARMSMTFDSDIETIKNLFSRAVERLGQRHLTCFVDALDECQEDQTRDMVAFFESLGQSAVSSKIQLHICFSSRHYPHITIEKGVYLILEDQDGHSQDIVKYLRAKLKDGGSKKMEKIRDEMIERASGVFLWVVLVVPMLNEEFDGGRIHMLQRRLKDIPSDLDALFRDILTRNNKNIDALVLCLQWILYAKRPMKSEELYFAILAGVAPFALAAWRREEVTEQDMGRYILDSSKGLAEMTKSKHPTVQFIHESVRDFLLKGNGLNSLQSHLENNFPGSSHERLKECCQTYAKIDTSEYLPSNTPLPAANSEEGRKLRESMSKNFPFLEYAVHNVFHHADTASGYGISQTHFLENFPLGDWFNLDNIFEKYQVRRHKPDCSQLYILSEKSLPNLIRIELNQVQQLEIKGGRHGSPLNAALFYRNEAAVRALLLPDTTTWPAEKLPLNHSVSLTTEYQESIKFILKMRDELISQKFSQNYGSLLVWAAERGYEGVVRLFLATGKVDVNGESLSRAAAGGHEAIFKLLLATGKVDVNGESLLSAAAGGYEAIVKLHLATGKVDINIKGEVGKTPLSRAAEGGYKATVKLLLATSKVDVDIKDDMDWTPLMRAGFHGHEAIVKLLLATGKVRVDTKAGSGHTPLLLAAAGGHEAIFKLFLDTGKVDVDISLSLLRAAERGHEAIVKLILATDKFDINSKGWASRTPLWYASQGGHKAIVKLLVDARQGLDLVLL